MPRSETTLLSMLNLATVQRRAETKGDRVAAANAASSADKAADGAGQECGGDAAQEAAEKEREQQQQRSRGEDRIQHSDVASAVVATVASGRNSGALFHLHVVPITRSQRVNKETTRE